MEESSDREGQWRDRRSRPEEICPTRELDSCLTFDHVHVIGPVPDGQGDGLLVLLHQLHHHGLLLGCHTAADHSPALAGQINKVLLLLLLVGLCPSPLLSLFLLLFCCSGEFQFKFLFLLFLLQQDFIL